MEKLAISIDYTEFARAAKGIAHKEFPEKIVAGFSYLAAASAGEVRTATRAKFNLHSNYIPSGVKSIPLSSGQRSAAENAVRRFGDIRAAVYVRGAMSPKRSLDFMSLHETGGDKTPHGNFQVAVPTKSLARKSSKTTRGATRKRWKPKTLLARFNAKGSSLNSSTTSNRGLKLGPKPRRLPGSAFLIKGAGGAVMIARRKSLAKTRNLEFLYSLKPRTSIKKRWDFEPIVFNSVNMRYKVLIKFLKKMRTKGV